MLAVSLDSYSLWDLPPRVGTPVPDWLGRLAETVGGLRVQRVLDVDGHSQIITETTPWGERFTLWEQLRASSDDDRYTKIAQWFVADPEDRERAHV